MCDVCAVCGVGNLCFVSRLEEKRYHAGHKYCQNIFINFYVRFVIFNTIKKGQKILLSELVFGNFENSKLFECLVILCPRIRKSQNHTTTRTTHRISLFFSFILVFSYLLLVVSSLLSSSLVSLSFCLLSLSLSVSVSVCCCALCLVSRVVVCASLTGFSPLPSSGPSSERSCERAASICSPVNWAMLFSWKTAQGVLVDDGSHR